MRINVNFDFQTKANQAAIWTFNALATTDAFIEREKSLEFIERLEKHSMEADAIKTQADLIINDLKERKRELTKKLKSKAFSPQMQAVREQAEAQVNANAQAIFNATQLEKTSDARGLK